jgi:hypothetical protein
MMKYEDSKSKSQMIDDELLVLSIIYIVSILSLNKTFSLIDTGISKIFCVSEQF